jgi:hypothetical protein
LGNKLTAKARIQNRTVSFPVSWSWLLNVRDIALGVPIRSAGYVAVDMYGYCNMALSTLMIPVTAVISVRTEDMSVCQQLPYLPYRRPWLPACKRYFLLAWQPLAMQLEVQGRMALHLNFQ